MRVGARLPRLLTQATVAVGRLGDVGGLGRVRNVDLGWVYKRDTIRACSIGIGDVVVVRDVAMIMVVVGARASVKVLVI